MLSLDLSKAIPQATFGYLAALVPGFFFEIGVLLGNPALIASLLRETPSILSLSHYEKVAIGIFLAFVIGSAFMFLVSPLVQTLVEHCYKFRIFAWRKTCKWFLAPLLNWLSKKAWWQRRPWVFNSLRYAQGKSVLVTSVELRNAYDCWRSLARRILKVQYGIELHKLGREWICLYWTLGTPTAEDVRGQVFVIAIHATGWAGLAAARFAPVLFNRYYLTFCIFMVLVGLHHDIYVARRRVDPLATAFVNTRALLREYRKTSVTVDQHSERGTVPGDGEI